ncbi:MAG TPA: hypothetical protein VH279_14910 [Solirubrobacteraceae bacterium]|jgi:hypothetical protein|nr:hypothetical protein [Solirubrobacteraceae bacterium]
MSARTRIAPAAVAAALSLAVVVAPASATKPVGECTQSYSRYTLDDWLDISSDSNVFQEVNHNGDDFICFKSYPNGLHQDIYLGNLIDNMAAPHS